MKPKSNPPSGFTLIVTVLTMSLLTLLAIGLLSLSTVSLRNSTQTEAQSTARANARLALMTALGELQRYLGPDQRISARGETLVKHPHLMGTVAPNTPQSWWVGASNSDREPSIGDGGQAVVWLVSGLDPSSSAKTQIESPFSGSDLEPVALFTSKSLDLDKLTGGKPVLAGRIPIEGPDGVEGAMAYFIDDNGMKAQLAAGNSLVQNSASPPLGAGVLPGTYDISILHEMESLGGADPSDFYKMGSLGDLPLMGSSLELPKNKYFSYTSRSLGVLSDVKNGGLKRDLTIAFENEGVFSKVFPKGGRNTFDERYIVMDPEKFESEDDLRQNGYIHFGIFKDYYNVKKYIIESDGIASLYPVLFNKSGIYSPTYDGGNDSPFAQGRLGPHAIGGPGTPAIHNQLPYGDFLVNSNGDGENVANYRHSPVGPVLSRLQQNAWVELLEPSGNFRKHRIKTNVQVWASHYNPYNVGLRAVGDYPGAGLRLHTYPQVQFSIPGVMGPTKGLGNKRESHVPRPITLKPGRSHVCAFKASGAASSENDKGLYDDRVRDRTVDTVFTYTDIDNVPEGSVNLNVEFYHQVPFMGHGTDNQAEQFELSQAFWSPIAWDEVDGMDGDDIVRKLPGKKFELNLGVQELNENAMSSLSFQLRTSREAGVSVRPLADANVRAMLNNPKWDSALDLPVLAAYSSADFGEAFEPFFAMDRRDNPRGYSYWGGDSTPVDGYDRVILFDIPRRDLVSLGQLQHANAGRFSYEPTYITGNSYANPRIPKSRWKTIARDTFSTSENGLENFRILSPFYIYDASYLVNEVLFDSYIFTTIPQVRDNYDSDEPSYSSSYFDSLLAGEQVLPNPRFIPYEPPGLEWSQDILQETGDDTSGAFFHNAGHLLVDGAFNVNSTSVDAWEAFLSGTRGLPVAQMNEEGIISGFQSPPEGVRFPRVQAPMDDGAEADQMDESFWIGFRELTQDEVRELAGSIVDQIRERGPFLTLGEFVNRKLEDSELGDSGALQAALDITVNTEIDTDFGETADHPELPDNSNQSAGFPGYLMQGDILQALSPQMSPRSDSFTIRAYGEARNPNRDVVEARAWCEAVVQRYPDPVLDSDSGPPLEELTMPSSNFGRRFRMVSFRWLSPEEV